jgi:hypothetical protein
VFISELNRSFRPDVLERVGLPESMSGYRLKLSDVEIGKCVKIKFVQKGGN